jgi:hypothetical protein
VFTPGTITTNTTTSSLTLGGPGEISTTFSV